MGRISLRRRLDDFCRFLAERCSPEEKRDDLKALNRSRREATRPGPRRLTRRRGRTKAGPPPAGQRAFGNGRTPPETRRTLLQTFNTPLFPEILVASRVLAEGVDLHLSCRHVIHHDLDWNPSMLENRTGRVDRLGCLAETPAPRSTSLCPT